MLFGVETVLERVCVHPVVINLFSDSIRQSLPEAAVGMWVCDTGRMLLPTGLACYVQGTLARTGTCLQVRALHLSSLDHPHWGIPNSRRPTLSLRGKMGEQPDVATGPLS